MGSFASSLDRARLRSVNIEKERIILVVTRRPDYPHRDLGPGVNRAYERTKRWSA